MRDSCWACGIGVRRGVIERVRQLDSCIYFDATELNIFGSIVRLYDLKLVVCDGILKVIRKRLLVYRLGESVGVPFTRAQACRLSSKSQQ